MEKMTSPAASAPAVYKVYGTVRDQYQQHIVGALIGAFDKDIRSEQDLGRAKTDQNGYYEIDYVGQQFALTDKNAADVFVRLYNANGGIRYESPITYNAPQQLELDIDLSGQAFEGPSDFEQMQAAIIPYTGDLDLSTLSENDKLHDITFLINKTGLPQDKIEDFGMAWRFGSLTKVEPAIYYGLLRENIPGNTLSNSLSHLSSNVYEPQLNYILDGMMHENIDVLMSGIKKAIADNIIAYRFTASLSRIREQLTAAMNAYAQSHPVTGDPSQIFTKLQIAGLSKDDSDQFMTLYSQHLGTIDQLFTNLQANPTLGPSTDKVNAVFQLSGLTNGNMDLTRYLVESQSISRPDDLKKLAGYDSHDWQSILEQIGQTGGGRTTPGERLEAGFTSKFPTAAFTARLQKDTQSPITHAGHIAGFLNAHPEFDLLHTRVHQFANAHPEFFSQPSPFTHNTAAPGGTISPDGTPPAALPDQAALTDQLKKIQRVFKIAPTYQATAALMQDNIHSAVQVYRMGKENFVRKYGNTVGQ